jgi:hypothetical protein
LGRLVRRNGLAHLMRLRFSEIVHRIVGASAKVAIVLSGWTVILHVNFLELVGTYDMRWRPQGSVASSLEQLLLKVIGNDKRTTWLEAPGA